MPMPTCRDSRQNAKPNQSKGIGDGKTSLLIPFDQAWSRAYKKVDVCVSIAPYAEKYASQGAENGHFPIQKRSLAFEDQ